MSLSFVICDFCEKRISKNLWKNAGRLQHKETIGFVPMGSTKEVLSEKQYKFCSKACLVDFLVVSHSFYGMDRLHALKHLEVVHGIHWCEEALL